MRDCSRGDAVASEAGSDRCPGCGEKGTRVADMTLRALLTWEGLDRGVPPEPRFCATLGCPVVYFDNAVPVRFTEDALTVPVHAKRPGDGEVPVCYCFGHTPAAIEREIVATGRSTASTTIAAEVKAGHCACEVKNPKGTCCLGDVSILERGLLSVATPSGSFVRGPRLRREAG